MENCSHFGDINGKLYVGGLVGALLNLVEAPTLHTYEVRTSSNYSSGYHKEWYYESITNGSSTEKYINNCTVIGNVKGGNYVGGLEGSETTANGYSTISLKTTSGYVFEGIKFPSFLLNFFLNYVY